MKTRIDGRIDFRYMTEADKYIVANGCGAKRVPVPDWGHFMDACNEHDLRYWEGHTEVDREIADREFLINMHRAACGARWWLKWPLYAAARLYFAVVKRTGVMTYNYSRRRGPEDLRRLRAELDSF